MGDSDFDDRSCRLHHDFRFTDYYIERTNMIGILKALGANNFTIRRTFLWFAVFLIGKGMLWGNAIGLAFCILQSQFGLFKLDPELIT